MRPRYVIGLGLAVLAVLLTLVEWQVSFDFGEFGPANPGQTYALWAVSTVIFLATVALGFMLFRTFVKLYLDRQRNREGSRFQTKLLLGAFALSSLPVVFLALFSYAVLNRNIDKWFGRPTEGIRIELIDTAVSVTGEIEGRARALGQWLSLQPAVLEGTADFARLCEDNRIAELRLDDENGTSHRLCGTDDLGRLYSGRTEVPGYGTLVVRVRPPLDLAQKQTLIDEYVREYNQLSENRRSLRNLYLFFIVLISLFILFVATWIATQLAREISSPISAILKAAGQVRGGNLGHRVKIQAIDEMATLVRAFNDMTQGLEQNSRELESRRRFTEAILESIPTGVISLTSTGKIQRVNRALRGLFTEEQLEGAATFLDLLPEHTGEIEYLMKRARRTGIAASQIDLERPRQVLHLAVTISALRADEPDAPGYVVILEDTSELLHAQKSAAWHEVARRVAHELKNPLTPIALSADRIARQLDRVALPEETARVLRQCSSIISKEVESVKALTNEFSELARFPAAQPVRSDLNEIVRDGLEVFEGRLDTIELRVELAEGLPAVNLDPDQFKRVVVNLVDNAAEAMRDSLVKRLLVATRPLSEDAVELLIADTGRGVSAADREKLFLPYFSTKQRGTGLGLAIVSHILAEHDGRIRVEENQPMGTRFYIELPIAGVVPSPPAVEEPAVDADPSQGDRTPATEVRV